MDKKYTKEEILKELKEILVTDFELDEELLVPSANLFTTLELDSIDAVDLAVRLQRFTDKKLSPEEFKNIRTIEDVVNTVYELLW